MERIKEEDVELDEIKQTMKINFDTKCKNDHKLIINVIIKDADDNTVDEGSVTRYTVSLMSAKKKWLNKEPMTDFEKFLTMLQVDRFSDLWEIAKGNDQLMQLADNIIEILQDETIKNLYEEEKE